MRKFADIFAFCNCTVFAELLYFESHLVRSTMANFEELASAGVVCADNNRAHWDRLLGSFTDIKQTLVAASV